MLLAIQFTRFGPYHLARLRSAKEALEKEGWTVIGLQTASEDATYDWKAIDSCEVHTVFEGKSYEAIPSPEMEQGVKAALDRLKPDAVAIAGWATKDSRACLKWCNNTGAKAVLMSETRRADAPRFPWKEWLKSRVVRRFDAALVGGNSHRDYLLELGMPAQRIALGYDVIDDSFFEAGIHQWKDSLPPYFLASNRFIPRKNLNTLIQAYSRHIQKRSAPWSMVLLGDGSQRSELLALCCKLGLRTAHCAPWEHQQNAQPTVFFPGFRQIDELPRFYAHAGCFVHPATSEPWGLVLNEAAACGLPLLSGNNVGAAEELLCPGVNGWSFDARDAGAISDALDKIADLSPEQRQAMGNHSLRLLKERAPAAAFGEGLAHLLKEPTETGLKNA